MGRAFLVFHVKHSERPMGSDGAAGEDRTLGLTLTKTQPFVRHSTHTCERWQISVDLRRSRYDAMSVNLPPTGSYTLPRRHCRKNE